MTSFTDLHPSTRRAVIRRLDKAADLIRQGWTRGKHARDADGNETGVADPSATCWCLVGAIMCATEDLRNDAYTAMWDVVAEVTYDLYGRSAFYVNDEIARDRRTPLRVLRETKKRVENA